MVWLEGAPIKHLLRLDRLSFQLSLRALSRQKTMRDEGLCFAILAVLSLWVRWWLEFLIDQPAVFSLHDADVAWVIERIDWFLVFVFGLLGRISCFATTTHL